MSKPELKVYRVVRVVEMIFEAVAKDLDDAKKQINDDGSACDITVISEDWQVKK